MPPKPPLPLSEEWTDPDAYVDELLSFITSSDLFRHVCGGVHMQDFLTRQPDLYTELLPESWRTFFDKHEMQDILHLLLREDIYALRDRCLNESANGEGQDGWNGGPLPPTDLVEYIYQIRRLSLGRDFVPAQSTNPTIPKHISVGMNMKKYHEVAHFSDYVDSLCNTVAKQRGEGISHIVDFGSGQNYLGRTLASQPYNRHIIAIERRHQYIRGAKGFDVHAKLSEKQVVFYNKKEDPCKVCKDSEEPEVQNLDVPQRTMEVVQSTPGEVAPESVNGDDDDLTVVNVFRDVSLEPGEFGFKPDDKGAHAPKPKKPVVDVEALKPGGAMDYIEHEIKDGYLEPIIKDVVESPPVSESESQVAKGTKDATDPNVMVISLHSCGNLLHHGVRSLVLNPSVKAIAMIGCCYNLVTERLGPATYKLPILRSLHPRLTKEALAYDPHGFPMSKRLEDFEHDSGTGVKINITARSMSLQAPYNWSRPESENFFTRHFYRTLLQRILVDRKIVSRPSVPTDLYEKPASKEDSANPLVVGSLRKAAFVSFRAYVRAATAKLTRDPESGEKVRAGMEGLTEEDLDRYEKDFQQAKKQLSITWSLMAFSASLIEAVIVVDRWQFLREHDEVKDAWVEPVFDYTESPRNLAVIGIKK
ncbi:uncharacterized protein ASPGLDRAFT_48596 [Aspergillus glaucus CBS 516.65]|uniref:Methyltransferase domain-containing protein n=1 Tax=Aspergillus glaucus CBS 516.65 TaxID=1160497 RepID=A0A1L9VH03_ASPGL|nr:hypothetical protein ASPGLDRAFT_48596 [Aspergillus glaucus CBS 516.65]OJJ83207.1 hypothetical protein ASPGLDRAFT_48596 [Aspergillus glaucus CBS 516.65]